MRVCLLRRKKDVEQDAAAFLAHIQQIAPLRSGLQSVRQLKQSLLIVNDVKVVHAGSHIHALARGHFTSWEKPETDRHTDYHKYSTVLQPNAFLRIL